MRSEQIKFITELGRLNDRETTLRPPSSAKPTLNITFEEQKNPINKPTITLFNYQERLINLRPVIASFMDEISRVFSKDYNISIRQNFEGGSLYSSTLNDLINKLFSVEIPFPNIDIVERFLDNFSSSSKSFESENNQAMKDILKKYFSKGAFSEFRAQLGLHILKSAGIIQEFIKINPLSRLDRVNIDFLILTFCKKTMKYFLRPLQVKSVEHEQRSKGRSSIPTVFTFNSSLIDIAESIKKAIFKQDSPSLDVGEFLRKFPDPENWLAKVIQHFNPRSQQA